MNYNEQYEDSLTQHVRMAVVMYGGVSLAIYMNGISQELLNVVRATSPLGEDRKPSTTEVVYRRIGQILYHGRDAAKEKQSRQARKAEWARDKNRAITDVIENETERAEVQGAVSNLRTRVLIDILSGTSAGGINAVFLAKALANEQDLGTVKQVWMKEADIDTLLNDAKSDGGEFKSKNPKTSLLNSQRMLGKLLRALDEMDEGSNVPATGSRFGNEIDLFVTTTDLNGLFQPIQLTNEVILERVHKLHFHFAYKDNSSTAQNDFSRDYNTMLAFAARCTSSFPGAFEPMTFQDVNRFHPGISKEVSSTAHPFYKFFAEMDNFGSRPGQENSGPTEERLHFTQRPLADGGYLNNKPFSFALEIIKTRNSTKPVRRLLLYLDPFPEEITDAPTKRRIAFTENLLLAGSTLPRYQTIREDIERVQQRNRDLRKAKLLLEEVEQNLISSMNEYFSDQDRMRAEETEKKAKLQEAYQRPPKYQEKYVSEMVAEFENGYIGYHRLSVSTVSDQLAELYAGVFGFNVNSDEVYAIRMLVHAWRTDNFEAENSNRGKLPENRFLFHYDLGFRFRRLKYMSDEIDELLAKCAKRDAGQAGQEIRDAIKGVVPQASNAMIDLKQTTLDLKDYRKAAIEALRELESRRQELWGTYPGQVLNDATNANVKKLRDAFRDSTAAEKNTWILGYADLQEILKPVSDDECQERANEIYQRAKVKHAFSNTAAILADILRDTLTTASQNFLNKLNPERAGSTDGSEQARANGPTTNLVAYYLWKRYQYFEGRDMIVFPIMPDKLTGKTRPTEIYRIGPQDATFVYGDDQGGVARRAKKLAGTALMDFGAFLDDGWRRNDMLWGRLDGAERIIESLLPEEDDRDLREELTREATEIILKEEFTPRGSEDLARNVQGYLRSMTTNKSPKLADELLRLAKSDGDRLDLFRAYYSRPEGPPLEKSVGWVKRATGILGAMFRGLDETSGINAKLGGWIGRAGAFGANFVEFTLPDRLWHKLAWHWLGMVYLAETILLLVGAFVYRGSGLETAGWIALLLTGALHYAASVVGRWLSTRRPPQVLSLVVLAIAVLTGLAALHYGYHWTAHDLMSPLTKLRGLIIAWLGGK